MRKENKLRPYRVDFFDIEEMKDYDLALVRSQVVRAATAGDAVYEVVEKPEFNTTEYPSLVLIRAYRFYKELVTKKDVYTAVEDLFTPNKAVKIMEQVEAYRKKKNEKPCPTCGKGIDNDGDGNCAVCTSPVYQAQQAAAVVPPPVASTEHVTRFSDSSLYDEVCTNCGATDASGKLEQPCPAAPPATAPTTGPDSPATIAVVADLQGMISHDAHEQAMDTFKPESVPEGKRFPDPTNAPITLNSVPMKEHDLLNPVVADCPQCESVAQSCTGCGAIHLPVNNDLLCAHCAEQQPVAGRAPTSWTYGLPGAEEPLVEPDQAVGPSGRPFIVPAPHVFTVGDAYRVAAVMVIGAAVLLYFILRGH
jgi:hypothetical protein